MTGTERLRGLNIGGWMSQIDAIKEKDPGNFPGVDKHICGFISEADFALQKSWGFNHVRIPIDYYHFFDEAGTPDETRFVYLDNAIHFARTYGLRCIIDLHECPGHDFADATAVPVQSLFVDKKYAELTVRMWSYIAERYAYEPHVLFEPLNEPVAPDGAAWNAVKDPACIAIRKHAPDRTIVVGSNMWNWPSTYHEMTPLPFDNVIYNFHFYEPLLFTHQGAPWMHEPEIRRSYSYPADYGAGFTRKYGFVHSAGVWNKDRIRQEIVPVAEFGKRHGASIICNEFGVYAPVPIDVQLLWLDDFLSVLKELDIGYTYWNFKNLDFGIISRGEQLHLERPQYANPERINYQVLGVLQKF